MLKNHGVSGEDEIVIQTGLSDYLLETVQLGASDLHLTAGLPPMVRVDGESVLSTTPL